MGRRLAAMAWALGATCAMWVLAYYGLETFHQLGIWPWYPRTVATALPVLALALLVGWRVATFVEPRFDRGSAAARRGWIGAGALLCVVASFLFMAVL